MSKVKLYLKDTYNELAHKVTWPTYAELQNSAIVVMVASVVIALSVWIMDTAFSKILTLLYGLF